MNMSTVVDAAGPHLGLAASLGGLGNGDHSVNQAISRYEGAGGKKGKRKIGKVFHTVFDPQKPYVVGFIVKRPDLLWMFKRKDKFIAFDATEIVDGRVHPTMGAIPGMPRPLSVWTSTMTSA